MRRAEVIRLVGGGAAERWITLLQRDTLEAMVENH
jgi:hypothetical protein